MNIIVSGKNMDITPSLKKKAQSKIAKFDKYLTNITETTMTFSIQKKQHIVEVLITANGAKVQAEGVAEDHYSAIDDVVDKLERQLKKVKDKKVSHRKSAKSASQIDAETVVAARDAGPQEGGIIIKRKRQAPKPMTPEEAAMALEGSEMSFVVFKNDETGSINVLYKMKDGNLGLIETS